MDVKYGHADYVLYKHSYFNNKHANKQLIVRTGPNSKVLPHFLNKEQESSIMCFQMPLGLIFSYLMKLQF